MTARGIDVADELGVVGALMLDDAGAFQQTALVGLTLEVVAQAALNDTLQVACKLTHLARSEEHVGRAVVVEEQGGVMEVAQTRVDGPRSFSLRSGENIGVAHRTGLVGSQECPKLTVVVLQRRSPLSAPVDRTFLQVVLRRVGQLVEDIADGLPVLQVLRGHDGSTRHEVHGCGNQVKGIADADDVRVGHVGPQHGILNVFGSLSLGRGAYRQQQGHHQGLDSHNFICFCCPS